MKWVHSNNYKKIKPNIFPLILIHLILFDKGHHHQHRMYWISLVIKMTCASCSIQNWWLSKSFTCLFFLHWLSTSLQQDTLCFSLNVGLCDKNRHLERDRITKGQRINAKRSETRTFYKPEKVCFVAKVFNLLWFPSLSLTRSVSRTTLRNMLVILLS